MRSLLPFHSIPFLFGFVMAMLFRARKINDTQHKKPKTLLLFAPPLLFRWLSTPNENICFPFYSFRPRNMHVWVCVWVSIQNMVDPRSVTRHLIDECQSVLQKKKRSKKVSEHLHFKHTSWTNKAKKCIYVCCMCHSILYFWILNKSRFESNANTIKITHLYRIWKKMKMKRKQKRKWWWCRDEHCIRLTVHDHPFGCEIYKL